MKYENCYLRNISLYSSKLEPLQYFLLSFPSFSFHLFSININNTFLQVSEQEVEVNAGETVRVSCSSSSPGQLRIEWSRLGGTLPSVSVWEIIFSSCSLLLFISL